MTYGRQHHWRSLLCGILLLGIAVPIAASDASPPRASLKTVEGHVLDIGSIAGEGGIEVIQVSIAPKDNPANPIKILLAPAEVMESIGFAVQTGDTLKIKYFVSEEGSCKAHKVLNSSRGLMVRLRTLRQIPLWTNQGLWQGGPGRMHHGPGSGRGGGSP